ncbi:hypothetical protein [Niveibacterium sp.]|uniref:hypothetical protein n=1 Tax=Niveibacterium sp. TaxID=2017444 RepID=UPI0035AF0E4E
MTRIILLLFGFAAVGCATQSPVGAERPEVLRDVEGYAIASCLTHQPQPLLKDQGDAWAAVIVQRMKGDIEALSGIAEQVAHETASGDMAVIRNEAGPEPDKALPLLYCGEIIDKPAVRTAIQKALAELEPAYKP